MTVEVLFQHDKNGESIDLSFLAELYHQSIAFQEFEKKSNLPSVPLNIFLPAWCHKSFLHEFKMEGVMSYERMEFLGDAIFGAYISERLYHQFPTMPEGPLSKLKSQLVSRHEMARLAEILDLPRLTLVGRGELKNKNYLNVAKLTDLFESTVGAVYLSHGVDVTHRFLNHVLSLYEEQTGNPYINESRVQQKDAKGPLQEWSMKTYQQLPNYKFTLNDEVFSVDLLINNKVVASASSKSKKDAERKCAEIFLTQLTHGETHAH